MDSPLEIDATGMIGFTASHPFTSDLSKNKAKMPIGNRIVLTKEYRAAKNDLEFTLKCESKNVKFQERKKIWLNLMVQMPSIRTDAVNMIDGICDALKEAIKIDDRWYAIERLDWEIVKEKPEISFKVYQYV